MKPALLFNEYIWLVSTIRRAGKITFSEINALWVATEMSGGVAMPLHHTQRELCSTPEHTDFELTLRPTADFITPLLSRGAAIRVLSPQWLVLAIKQAHLDAASRYE